MWLPHDDVKRMPHQTSVSVVVSWSGTWQSATPVLLIPSAVALYLVPVAAVQPRQEHGTAKSEGGGQPQGADEDRDVDEDGHALLRAHRASCTIVTGEPSSCSRTARSTSSGSRHNPRAPRHGTGSARGRTPASSIWCWPLTAHGE